MRRLAILVLLAYAALFMSLTWPWLCVSMLDASDFVKIITFQADPKELISAYGSPVFWVFLAVAIICQAGLLLTPVRLASGRPTTRRSVILPIAVAGFLIGLLAVGLIWTLIELFRWHQQETWQIWAEVGLGAGVWLLWGLVFMRLSRGADPKAVVLSQCWRLFQGGAVTFLVAVPCHIWVRQRNECCAGFYTFVGLTFGAAVMLLSFGPGIYFLYAERIRKLRAAKSPARPE